MPSWKKWKSPWLWLLVGMCLAAVPLLAPVFRSAGPQSSYRIEPVTGSALVYVPAQEFVMGTPEGVPGREAQETTHSVMLSKPYYIGRHEVTQAQWTAVMGANPSHFSGCSDCPVERVNFYDVEAFLIRLNAGGGDLQIRLPTEAEWELACRGGGAGLFGGGSTLGSLDANIDGNYPYNSPKGEARGRTTPAGSFRENGFGLFDMSGNVWEWVQDEHCRYPTGPVRDPVGACGAGLRVIRGGSWTFDGNSARCGLRYTHRPQDLGYSLGFRLAADAR